MPTAGAGDEPMFVIMAQPHPAMRGFTKPVAWAGPNDSDFIALANPTAILAILSELEQMRRALALADGELNETSIADARLIAAAPDLLAALIPFAPAELQAFEEILWSDYADDEPASLTVSLGDIRRARAAIAKAIGGH